MKTAIIQVNTKQGKEKIKAYPVESENFKVYFAVHKRLFLRGLKPNPREFGWTITHLPSGCRISEFKLKRDADFVARECYLHSDTGINSKSARAAVRAFPRDFGQYLNYIHAYCGLLKLPTYTEWKSARA